MNRKSSWITVLVVAGLASVSLAQEVPAAHAGMKTGRGAYGFVAMIDHKVGFSLEQKDAVRGLLAEQREKSRALRQETDRKIRGLLNPDQQKKFDAVLAEQKASAQRKR
jgi:hypothetical protein